jgi:hypothetical protein
MVTATISASGLVQDMVCTPYRVRDSTEDLGTLRAVPPPKARKGLSEDHRAVYANGLSSPVGNWVGDLNQEWGISPTLKSKLLEPVA